jgi:hypothetical protein
MGILYNIVNNFFGGKFECTDFEYGRYANVLLSDIQGHPTSILIFKPYVNDNTCPSL